MLFSAVSGAVPCESKAAANACRADGGSCAVSPTTRIGTDWLPALDVGVAVLAASTTPRREAGHQGMAPTRAHTSCPDASAAAHSKAADEAGGRGRPWGADWAPGMLRSMSLPPTAAEAQAESREKVGWGSRRGTSTWPCAAAAAQLCTLEPSAASPAPPWRAWRRCSAAHVATASAKRTAQWQAGPVSPT